MNEADAVELVQNTVWTVLVASSPAVIAAMLVGVSIAIVQALTQVQEMTLTFVPKIVAIFLALIVFATFIGAELAQLAAIVMARIEGGF